MRTCDICGAVEPPSSPWSWSSSDVVWCPTCVSKCPPPPPGPTRHHPVFGPMTTAQHLPFYLMNRADWPKYGFTPSMITGQPAPGWVAQPAQPTKVKPATSAGLMIATAATKPKKKPKKKATKGTHMNTTTTPADSGVESFYATVEMQIEPELQSGNFNGNLFKLKQVKDQDVRLVNGEITVVDEIVTQVKPTFDNGAYLYDYAGLKKEFQQLADEVKKNGSVVKGQIIVRVAGSTRDHYPEWLRLVVVNDKVVAQSARLGWEDGTQSPFPNTGD